MPENIIEERLRWVLPLVQKQMRLKEMVKVCPHSRRSLLRWCAAYRKGGKRALLPKSTAPKTQPHETPIRIKEEVIALRLKTHLCAQKLHWRLEKQGLVVPVSTVGKILKAAHLVRPYRAKKVKYKYIKVQRQPGELVEIDVKHVPGPIAGRKYFQYTAIDCATRWRHLEIYESEATWHAVKFLQVVMKKFPYPIAAIKTDNHSTFTNYYVGTTKRPDLTVKTIHALDRFCAAHGITHYLIDPGKPAQNGTVERSHREDEEKFYRFNNFTSLAMLKRRLRKWNKEYNNLEHCGLDGKTPNEMLEFKVPKVIG